MKSSKRPLPQASPGSAFLGQATIMDRALSAQYGVSYVHLAAFAIDVDRVFMATEDSVDLPLGWEVALCLGYLLGRVDTKEESVFSMVEDTCLHVLSFAPGDAPLGSELAFAVYCGVELGKLPSSLAGAFHSWKSTPRQLVRTVSALFERPEHALAEFATHCLAVRLPAPLAPPTVETLNAVAQQRFPLKYIASPEDDATTD